MAALALAATAAFVGGCANGAALPLPGADGGRGSLAGQRLGATRDEALAVLAERFAPPRCTFSRLAPIGARKAFPTERCEHVASAPAPVLGGHELERVITRFVDDTLVRVDAVFAAADVTDALRGPMTDRLGEPTSMPGTGAPRWTIGPDALWLIDGSLVLIDDDVARALPGLADGLPPVDEASAD